MATPSAPVAVESQPRAAHDWRRVALGTLLAFAVPLVVLSLAGALVRALSGSDGSNPLDAHALDWMIDLRSDGLTDVMRAVTTLGGTLFLVPLTVAGVVLLSWLGAQVQLMTVLPPVHAVLY